MKAQYKAANNRKRRDRVVEAIGLLLGRIEREDPRYGDTTIAAWFKRYLDIRGITYQVRHSEAEKGTDYRDRHIILGMALREALDRIEEADYDKPMDQYAVFMARFAEYGIMLQWKPGRAPFRTT